MSGHLAIELLSSYLDEEVTARQLRLVESHLGDCKVCSRRLEGLRSVAAGVRRLQSVAPPSTLGAAMERRIQVAAQEAEDGLGFERSLGRWLGQPVLAPLFAVILALGAILYLYSYGLSLRTANSTQVVVAAIPDDDMAKESVRQEPGARDASAPESRLVARAQPETAAPADSGGMLSPESVDVPVERPPGTPSAAGTVGPSGTPMRQRESSLATEGGSSKGARETDSDSVLEKEVSPVRGGAGHEAEVLASAPRARSSAVPAAKAFAEVDSEARSVAGRTFIREGGVWVEQGIRDGAADELLTLAVGIPDSETDPESVADLRPFSELGRVRLLWRGRIVEVVYSEY